MKVTAILITACGATRVMHPGAAPGELVVPIFRGKLAKPSMVVLRRFERERVAEYEDGIIAEYREVVE